MSRKWTQERLLEEIRKIAAENNGLAFSTQMGSRARNMAIFFFGSWVAACKAAGVKPASAVKKKEQKSARGGAFSDKQRERHREAVERYKERAKKEALCWRCACATNSAAFPCSWSAKLVLPEGAKILEFKNSFGVSRLVLECPNFVEEGKRDVG